MRSNEKAANNTSSPISRAKPSPQSPVAVTHEELFLRLQRTAGNQAVSNLITVSPVLQRAPEAATQPMPNGPGINAEVDRRFLERTNYRVGERLRKDRPEDAPYIREWLKIRDEVRAERQPKEHPSHAAKPATASPLPASGLQSLQNEGFGRWLL